MQNCDAVAEPLGLAHDVRAENDAFSLVAKLADGLQQGAGHKHVEPCRGFVENQHRRIVHDRPRDAHLLLHAGAHLGAEQIANVVHLQPGEEVFHPLAERQRLHAVQAAEVLDHLPGRHAIVYGGVRADETNLVADQGRLGQHVVPVHCRGAARGLQYGAEDAQGARLSRAVGTEQAVDLSRQCVERDTGQRGEFPAAHVGVRLRQLANMDHAPALRHCHRQSVPCLIPHPTSSSEANRRSRTRCISACSDCTE